MTIEFCAAIHAVWSILYREHSLCKHIREIGVRSISWSRPLRSAECMINAQENRMPHIQLLARANFQSLRGKAINKNSSAGHRDCPARLTRYSRIGSSDLGVAVPLMVAIENMKSCVIPGAETWDTACLCLLAYAPDSESDSHSSGGYQCQFVC